jgi:hypothetical protein
MIGSRIVLGIMFFPFCDVFLDLFFLPVFLAICRILELEAAISTVCARFWNWNFSFSMCTILVEFVRAAVSTVFAALLSSNISFSVLELV